MNRPIRTCWPVTLAIVAISFTPLPSDAAGPPRKPNVIVMVADDLGYAEIGC